MADNHYGGDSESEDDNFNPAPADLSDEEQDANDSSPRVSRKNDHRSSSPVADEDHDEDEDENERPSGRATKRPRIAADDDDDEGGEDDEEEEDDEEGGGHRDGDEDDEEDEEDEEDEDDVQHVSLHPASLLFPIADLDRAEPPQEASQACRCGQSVRY